MDFHNYVGNAPVRNMYDDGANLIAFSRGSKGWIAINNHPAPQTHTFQTGLPAGTYCDVIHGTFSKSGRAGSCTGPTVAVGGGRHGHGDHSRAGFRRVQRREQGPFTELAGPRTVRGRGHDRPRPAGLTPSVARCGPGPQRR